MVIGHNSALQDYTGPGTNWANGMNFAVNHTPGAGSIATYYDTSRLEHNQKLNRSKQILTFLLFFLELLFVFLPRLYVWVCVVALFISRLVCCRKLGMQNGALGDWRRETCCINKVVRHVGVHQQLRSFRILVFWHLGLGLWPTCTLCTDSRY